MQVRFLAESKMWLENYRGSSMICGPEDIVIYTARVSSGRAEDDLLEDGAKLLKYLINHKHWSPFEMATVTVDITTSLAIAPQILRHRSFSFQQFSMRYAKATEVEPVQLRYAASHNRQSSSEPVEDPELIEASRAKLQADLEFYQMLIDRGVSAETARMHLPTATQTRLYMTGSIRSWIHYIQARDHGDAQGEHVEIARRVKEIFVERYPVISEALGWTS